MSCHTSASEGEALDIEELNLGIESSQAQHIPDAASQPHGIYYISSHNDKMTQIELVHIFPPQPPINQKNSDFRFRKKSLS